MTKALQTKVQQTTERQNHYPKEFSISHSFTFVCATVHESLIIYVLISGSSSLGTQENCIMCFVQDSFFPLCLSPPMCTNSGETCTSKFNWLEGNQHLIQD